VDPHSKVKHRAAIGPAIGKNVRIERPKGKTRHPHARIRADEYGVVARVRTLPRVGRVEFEKEAQHIADAWRCHRVQVAQPKPGRLIVRGLRRDPLSEYLGLQDAPAGTYLKSDYSPAAYLGRDEWSDHRWAELAGVTGIAVGGLPDYGKTSLIRSLFCQDFGTPAVQYAVIDGKGGGDYLGMQDRLWLPIVGHDLEHAAKTLARCERLMNDRLAAAGRIPGPVNRWHVGPIADYPLITIVVDECHSFYDLEAVRGDKKGEQLVRQCRTSTANMIRMGRSVLFRVVVITQKQTSDAIPTAVRDICQLSLGFASKTESGAEAVLGELIKQYPSYSPTRLQEKPTYTGVFTVTLPTGADPFVRVRCPDVPDSFAAAMALDTAHLRTDPEQLLAVLLAESDNVYPFAAA
jgi:S-DNA-T family DNA segregation ATPase FtsK/SpoIIIE